MSSLVGDVSSSARLLPPLDGEGFVVARSAGAYLWDPSGRRHVDLAMGLGSTVLGHAPPAVVAAVSAALADGPSPAFRHEREHAAAGALARHAGPLDKVVFTNSGSEAVHLACRIARAATGRSRIAKMAAGFDGWLDEITLGNAGTAEAGFHDQHRPRLGRTTLLRFNDLADAERLFGEDGDIAAVLVEPMLANAGCIMPAPGYLEGLQALARRHGALVIADEVLTGFRAGPGLLSQSMGLDLDLATVGKAIGSGVPVAAVLGREAAMRPLIEGKILRGGTYSGNPMACAAVLATMDLLDAADYAGLLSRGDAFRAWLEQRAAAAGLPAVTSGLGNVFSLWFSEAPPGRYDEAARLVRPELSQALHLALRREGVVTIPSVWGRMYLSFAHDVEALSQLRQGFDRALSQLREG
jgi:glutamate-1-semialdehyde 2,1-aminomutase